MTDAVDLHLHGMAAGSVRDNPPGNAGFAGVCAEAWPAAEPA